MPSALDPADELKVLAEFDSVDDLIALCASARGHMPNAGETLVIGAPRGKIVVYPGGKVIVGGEDPAKPPVERKDWRAARVQG